MLNFNDLYTIEIDNIVHVCRLISYNNETDKYTISLRGNGVLFDISEDDLTDITPSGPLPRGFVQVDYIESNGSQYIDTGLEGKAGYTVEATLLFTTFTGNYAYFAGFGSTSSNRVYFTRAAKSSSTQGTDGWTFNSDSHNLSSTTVSTGVKYTYKSIMESRNQKLYRDGTLLDSATLSGSPSYGNLWIFAADYSGNPNGACSCQLYSCTISYGGEVVRNYIPCYRESDSVVGLYDTVGKKFYTNSGSGEFVTVTYKFVEYIQSTGTQYINTKLSPTNNSKMWLDFQPTSAQSSMYAGCRNTSSSNRYFTINSGNSATDMYVSFANKSNVKIDSMTTNRVSVEISQNNYVYNGTVTQWPSAPTTTPWTLSENILLGAVMQNGSSISLYSSAKFYGQKIWQYQNNDYTLLLDFSPCVKTPFPNTNNVEGEAGMMDLVNHVFYENSGSGSFIAGPDITD